MIWETLKKTWKSVEFVDSVVPADGLAPLGARPSAGKMMNPCLYGATIELKLTCIILNYHNIAKTCTSSFIPQLGYGTDGWKLLSRKILNILTIKLCKVLHLPRSTGWLLMTCSPMTSWTKTKTENKLLCAEFPRHESVFGSCWPGHVWTVGVISVCILTLQPHVLSSISGLFLPHVYFAPYGPQEYSFWRRHMWRPGVGGT